MVWFPALRLGSFVRRAHVLLRVHGEQMTLIEIFVKTKARMEEQSCLGVAAAFHHLGEPNAVGLPLLQQMEAKAFVYVGKKAHADFNVATGFNLHFKRRSRLFVHPDPAGERLGKALLYFTRVEVRIAAEVVDHDAAALALLAMTVQEAQGAEEPIDVFFAASLILFYVAPVAKLSHLLVDALLLFLGLAG
jgi:hypothetical protein